MDIITKTAIEFLRLKKESKDTVTTFKDFLESTTEFTQHFIYSLNNAKIDCCGFMDIYKDRNNNIFGISANFYPYLKIYQTITHKKDSLEIPTFLQKIF